MSYCGNCGFDDLADESMKNVRCQRCGAIKHGDGSVSYEDDRDSIEDMEDRIRDFDRGYDGGDRPPY